MQKVLFSMFLLFLSIGQINAQYFDSTDAYNYGRADRMSIDAQRAMIDANYKKAYKLFSESIEIRPTTMAYMGLMCLLQSGKVYKYNDWAQSKAEQYYVKARNLDNMNMSNAYMMDFYMILLYPGYNPSANFIPSDGNYGRSRSDIERNMNKVRQRIGEIQEQRGQNSSASGKIEYKRMERNMMNYMKELEQEYNRSE